MNLVERFLKYVSFDTQSDELTRLTPSTPGQMVFAEYLKSELESLGLEDITLDENGYLFATLPANTEKELPVIGFIAHMDTSPDMSGKNVTPRIVEKYDGSDIVLCAEENIVLSPSQFPELLDHKGEDLIVTNGKTLLGADDKAGIAEIVSAVVYLQEHPEIKHGKIRIGFNPDEEIGEGAHKLMFRSSVVSGLIRWTEEKLESWNLKISMLPLPRSLLKDVMCIRDMLNIK